MDTVAPTPPPNPLGQIVARKTAVKPSGIDYEGYKGKRVSLTPLHSNHAVDLYMGCDSPDLWDYMPDGPWPTWPPFCDSITAKAASKDPVYLAVTDPRDNNRALGYLSIMRIDIGNRVCEVGNVMFSPALQKTTAATEAFYLLLRSLIENFSYRRVEWKCNNLNEASKKAAERLGFVPEGVFRQHMIVKERNRDTAWFSITDRDWGIAKYGFERWLNDSNFDKDGLQKKRLEECREDVRARRP